MLGSPGGTGGDADDRARRCDPVCTCCRVVRLRRTSSTMKTQRDKGAIAISEVPTIHPIEKRDQKPADLPSDKMRTLNA
jgi:hypothetical protein